MRRRPTKIAVALLVLLLSIVLLVFFSIHTSNSKCTCVVNTSDVRNVNLEKNAICKKEKSRITPAQEVENISKLSTIKQVSNSKVNGVIIVAHARSGTSFLGGIFNAHPDFFFIYEPLNRLRLKYYYKKNPKVKEYSYRAEQVVKSIFNCNFTDNYFLEIISRHNYHRASCRSLVSPPFCKTTHEIATHFVSKQDWNLCTQNITAKVLNEICRNHGNVASKILLDHLWFTDLSWLVRVTSSSPVYLLYLVRDPRALIFSRYRLDDYLVEHRVNKQQALVNGMIDRLVKKLCDNIEINLRNIELHQGRIKLVRYEDLASRSEVEVRRIFSELQISTSPAVFRWIHNSTTRKYKSKLGDYSLSRNQSMSINSWRTTIPPTLLYIVEMRCARVMKSLGYLPVQGSQELLRDYGKPLYLAKMPDISANHN